MTEPKKPQATDFDPGDWLERAIDYGYGVTLFPAPAGNLGLSMAQPLGRRPEGPDPAYEINAEPGNYPALLSHLLAVGRVRHVPYTPAQKAILRQMKRRGRLHRRGPNRSRGLVCADVVAVAGERGLQLMLATRLEG